MANHKTHDQDSKKDRQEDATLSLHRAILAAQEIEHSAAHPQGSPDKNFKVDPERPIDDDSANKDTNK